MATLVNEMMATSPATGTYQNSGSIPTGGWNSGTSSFITNDNVNQWGDLEYTLTPVAPYTMKADFAMSTTSGADGQWLYIGWSTQPHQEGDSTGAGYLIFRNDFNNNIQIRWAGTSLASVNYTKDTAFDTLQADVTISAGVYSFVVKYLGSTVLTFTDTVARALPGSLYGWGSRSGGTANIHSMKNLILTDATGVVVTASSSSTMLLMGI